MHAGEFSELHLEPKVVEVKHNETEYADTEHQHVLRFPIYPFALCCNGIPVVAARMAVLDGEPDGIGKVNDHEHCEPHGSHEGIPVGTEHLANPVVGVFREDERKVHASVEEQEENQCEAGNTHYELTADGRVS